MPKTTKFKKILMIGGGPTVIGQGSELDYSCSQAIAALHEEDCEVVFVNSDAATISTDSDIADRTYIEPLTVESLTQVIEKEKPDALLPLYGGQTALNLAMFLDREGVLKKFNVNVIGNEAIVHTENRELLKETAQKASIRVPRGGTAASIEEGVGLIKEIGFPIVLRPAFSMGGAGSAVAYNMEESMSMLAFALENSPVRQTLIEEALLGWKEIDLELVRDSKGSMIVVASMESIDPVGVHSGDSAVVVPAQTLKAAEMKTLVETAEKAVHSIGIVGCANVRCGIDPVSGDVIVIGVTPCADRGSALASKVTGFPVARVAAKLAIGLTLEEIGMNAEPAVDCCAVKLPRFAFDKFPQADETLNTSMKAVGEAVAIGHNFKEALQKGIRSLENGRYGLGADGRDISDEERGDEELIRARLSRPTAERLFYIRYAVELGMSTDEIASLSKIDPWFIDNIRELVEFEKKLEGNSIVSVSGDVLREAKALGYSDIQLAHLLETDEEQVRMRRKVLGIDRKFCPIEGIKAKADAKKIVILAAGPNRIGQGIEFDYCCVHSAIAAREEGFESIIVNSNPDAVSTDPSVSGKLYLEPTALEDVLGIIDREKPYGVIAQMGGETPLRLSSALRKAGVPILGTPPEVNDRIENRRLFVEMAKKLGISMTDSDVITSPEEASEKARRIGYPALVWPNSVPGEHMMEIVYDDADLLSFVESTFRNYPGNGVVIEKFLEDAIEVSVDAVSDGDTALVCGVMEHIEQAGIHAGDSACSFPPYSLPAEIVQEIKQQTRMIAKELGIRGFLNMQYSVKSEQAFLLEVNPRASRTVPFLSKATGIPWAKVAAKILLGKSLAEQGITQEVTPEYVSVKEAVFPFVRFPGVDVVLGPEMKSTGEVMGLDTNFGSAYIKAQIAAGQNLPEGGTAFVSVAERDKPSVDKVGLKLKELGFNLVATKGTARVLKAAGVEVNVICKIGEGRPDAIDLIKNGEIDLIISTPSGKRPRLHEVNIRSATVARGIPIVTTIAGAKATLFGMEAVRNRTATVKSLQEQ